jgi:unsaturated rhamnogalacturonyl hydrolase
MNFGYRLQPITLKAVLFFGLLLQDIEAQAQRNVTRANDSNTPLHLLQPDYPVPYGIVKKENIKADLDRIYEYLNKVTPAGFVNSKTGKR